jgi:hypothetical protein
LDKTKNWAGTIITHPFTHVQVHGSVHTSDNGVGLESQRAEASARGCELYEVHQLELVEQLHGYDVVTQLVDRHRCVVDCVPECMNAWEMPNL